MDRDDFVDALRADRAKLAKFVETVWFCADKLQMEMKPGGCCEGRVQFHNLVDALHGVDGLNRDA